MRRLGTAAILLALTVSAAPASAEVKTMVVDYTVGGVALQGFLAWDDATAGKRPGVVVVHEWWGHNEHARNSARKLAEAGYVGFALDMYGKGKVAKHPDDAMKFMTEATKDPAVLGARFNAAVAELKKDPHVDPSRIAAIGYCFGGTVVISQARMGADLAAVASFHGGLGGLPVVSLLVPAVLAVVLAVCSEADAFVAASLSAFPLVGRLAFMVVGPMVDVKLVALQAGTFGRAFAWRFSAATFAVAVAAAALTGWWLL